VINPREASKEDVGSEANIIALQERGGDIHWLGGQPGIASGGFQEKKERGQRSREKRFDDGRDQKKKSLTKWAFAGTRRVRHL